MKGAGAELMTVQLIDYFGKSQELDDLLRKKLDVDFRHDGKRR